MKPIWQLERWLKKAFGYVRSTSEEAPPCEGPGVPANFVLYNGPAATLLAELNEEVNQLLEAHKYVPSDPSRFSFPMATGVEESDFGSEFFGGQLHPRVDDYGWYRGYRIIYGPGAEMILYTPWVWPQDSRPSLLFVTGGISAEVVEDAISWYANRVREGFPG